jgi:hypothetical protein
MPQVELTATTTTTTSASASVGSPSKESHTKAVSQLQTAQEGFLLAFQVFKKVVLDYLGEKEFFWSATYLKHGKRECELVNQSISRYNMSLTGIDGEHTKLFVASMLDGLSESSTSTDLLLRAYPQLAALNFKGEPEPWASQQFHSEFLSQLNYMYVSRVVLLPRWTKRYIKWKAVILSVQGLVDIYSGHGSLPPSGCGCIVC